MKKILSFIVIVVLVLLVFGGVVYFKSGKNQWIFPDVDSDPNATIREIDLHPVLNWSHRVIGGTYQGKWVNREKVKPFLRDGKKYKLYSLTGLIGEFESRGPDESGDPYYLTFVQQDEEIFDSRVGIAGDWDPMPRFPQEREFDAYLEDRFIEEKLQEKGLTEIPVVVQQWLEIDLEGDGEKEVLITASNINGEDLDAFGELSEDKLDEVRKDKYSIIVLRKKVGDEEKNFIITEDYNQVMCHEVTFIADIDDDRVMEFGVNIENIEAVPAEGFSIGTEKIYDIIDGAPVLLDEIEHWPN